MPFDGSSISREVVVLGGLLEFFRTMIAGCKICSATEKGDPAWSMPCA